ncbi:uncharacterized protein BDZ99DRAFT_575408 [Mytilinidion resinicola]|uniref:Rhodopsin domain-containing protein n=1 Tax=Mytilinidion resinicola TaxID=574789 RepID=A0A6A6Y6F4_9PEZI|nr:uncharacterized protein BDZ99DRAFT_575408 [Mytilinidion resinicola]KAF2804406.1 hypothetical protein BDZ99DRAFT_575408 [Mytilinidion resinicola]
MSPLQLDPAALAKLPPGDLSENIGHRVMNLAIAFLVLQSVFVVLFYISRYLNKMLNGWECWLFMPLAYIFCTALCICGVLAVKIGGEGRHIAAVLLEDPNIVTNRIKIDKAVEYIDLAAITSAKLAILCLYIRILSLWRSYRIAIYLTGTIIVLTWIAAILLSTTICHPYSYQWDPTIEGGHCGDMIRAYQFICVPNILTDFIMLLIPLPAVYKLHVQLPAKIGIFATFLTGSVGIVTSVLRMLSFLNDAQLLNDLTYNSIPTFIFTIIEAGVYLIAACMLSLRPLKRHIFKDKSFTKWVGSYLDRFSRGSSQGSISFGGLK